MSLLEELKNGKYNFIFIFILAIFIFHIYWKTQNIEKMSNVPDNIKEAVRQVYNADVEAIRNLSEVAKKLQAGGLIHPGNLDVKGDIKIGGNILNDKQIISNFRSSDDNGLIVAGSNKGENQAAYIGWENGVGTLGMRGTRQAFSFDANSNTIHGNTNVNGVLNLPNGWSIDTSDTHLRIKHNGDNKFTAHTGGVGDEWSDVVWGKKLRSEGQIVGRGGGNFSGGRYFFNDSENCGRLRVGCHHGTPGIFAEDGKNVIVDGSGGNMFTGKPDGKKAFIFTDGIHTDRNDTWIPFTENNQNYIRGQTNDLNWPRFNNHQHRTVGYAAVGQGHNQTSTGPI
jgi:hypothetical protein